MSQESNLVRTMAGALCIVAAASAGAGPGPGVKASLVPEAARKAAPDFALTDLGGKSASLSDYRGSVVLLNLWATWCEGCKEEMPWFADFQAKYGPGGLRVIGVSVDTGGSAVVKPFIDAKGVPYRILLGDERTTTAYAVKAMPATHLLDRGGRIAATYVGVVDRRDLESKIAALLASTRREAPPSARP
jgi:cytochrome c biogenesis protein CcmG/thiol:disulfide interchange protein DsbE